MREPEVSGPITGVALTALWRLLSCGVLSECGRKGGGVGVFAVGCQCPHKCGRWLMHPHTSSLHCITCDATRAHHTTPIDIAGNLHGPGVAEAVNAIVEDTTQCKFEASSPASDEVVLFNILQVRALLRVEVVGMWAAVHCVHAGARNLKPDTRVALLCVCAVAHCRCCRLWCSVMRACC